MRKNHGWIGFFLVLMAAFFLLIGCRQQEDVVTVYTSVDRNYSEQVFKDFEEKTGIRVLAVYDTEASKTTGMVNRLIEEKDHPVADVFWNGEFAQTILLKEKGVLAPYRSKTTEGLVEAYIDPEGYWTAFGGRMRCILVNTDLVAPEDYPTGFDDFLDPKYDPSRIGLAYPVFGTTATHGAAFFALSGEDDAVAFYQALYDAGIRVVDGNGMVRDLVADGQLDFGFTDTDDAYGAVKKGKPVEIIIPDQGVDQAGTLIIPNTVAMTAKSDNSAHAQRFIDYLLDVETRAYLVEIGWSQVGEANSDCKYCIDIETVKTMDVSLEEVFKQIERTKSVLKQVFIR